MSVWNQYQKYIIYPHFLYYISKYRCYRYLDRSALFEFIWDFHYSFLSSNMQNTKNLTPKFFCCLWCFIKPFWAFAGIHFTFIHVFNSAAAATLVWIFFYFSVGLLESVINLDNNNNNLWLLFSMAAVTPVTCKTLNSGQSSSKSLPSSLFAYLLVIDLHRGTHFEQMPSKPRCSHSQTLHPLLCQLSPAAIATWLSLPLI